MKIDWPLFVYGTLMYPTVFQQVTGRCPQYYPAFLLGYAPKCLMDRSYPGLVPLPGHQTKGLLIYDLDENILARLDAYEGAEYCLQEVNVFAQEGSRIALTYLLAEAAQDLTKEEIWQPDRQRLQA